MTMRLWIDPPSGWMYGFPAIYDPDKDGSMIDFMRSKGVPEDIIKLNHVRTWPVDSTVTEDEE